MASPATSPKLSYVPIDVACVASFREAISSVTLSTRFRKDHFRRHPLFLCEAYCLLWNHSGSGGLDRMKLSQQLQIGAYGAAIMDLVALGKIEIRSDCQTLSPGYIPDCTVRVIDPSPTFTFIDRVLFNSIIQAHDQGRSRSLQEWLSLAQESLVVHWTLKNLVSRGILGDINTACFGMFYTYPTLNLVPLETLEREVKSIALKELRPDSYMLSLLTLSRTVESYFSFVDPIMEKNFTKKEYRIAKENIRVIVESQGAVLRSPKFTRKKFSFEDKPAALLK